MKKNLFLFVAILSVALRVYAYDFETNGIYYNITSLPDKTVEVTNGDNYYSGNVVIPSTVQYLGNNYTVTRFGDNAFASCSQMTEIVIPNTVITMGSYVFSGCSNLTSLTIPASVTEIGDGASSGYGKCCFSGCSRLKRIVFEDSETTLLLHPNDWTSGSCRTFVSCKLEYLYIGRNIICAHEDHNDYCHPFYGQTKLETIEFGLNTTMINSHMFQRCTSLRHIIIPSNVKDIYANAFEDCSSLQNVELKEGVLRIGDNAFKNCSNITTFKFPASITNIGENAFLNCTNISRVLALGQTPANITQLTFPGTIYLKATLYVPTGLRTSYEGSVGWQNFANIIEKENITSFSVSVSPNEYVRGVVSGSGNYEMYSEIQIAATQNYGYHFVQWSDGITDNPRTIEITQDTIFAVEFAKNPTIQYICDMNMGYITGDTTLANSAEGYLTFSATSSSGYHFVQWNDSVTDNPRTIYLTQDTAFTAEFAPNKYMISVTCNSEYGIIEGDSGEFDYLTQKTYTAIPNYGYNFYKWSDNVTANPRTLIVKQDSNIVALFANNNYSIKYMVNDPTMGQVQGVQKSAYLQEVSFTAIPNHGYRFVQWSDSVTDNPRTIVLTQDTTFTAEFTLALNGQCGDSLYWVFANDTLAFNGNGEMYHYTAENMPWSLLIANTQYIEFASGMTSISELAFQNMINLRKVNLSSEIAAIGENAFANCTSVSTLTIPNSVTSLGASAFYGCSSIDTLIIGTGITVITDQFRGCTSLRYLQLGQGIESIDYGSFYDARQLTFIVCHPTLPPLAYPDEVGKERSFYNTNAQVLIPCDNFDVYQYDALWGSFNLKCLSSNSGTAVDGQVIVVPGDADATFTWPTDGSADTYNLEITKDSATFCSLIFDSEGRLLGIAFAPSANGQQPHVPMATLTTSGMSFQVTGLNYASQYRFSFETKDDKTQTLFAYTGGFHTNGTNGETPEGVEDINASAPAQKILLDGKIYILRGDKTYTLQGQEIK